MFCLKLCLVGTFAATVFGASIQGLPACAGNCVTSFGSCQQLDVHCICSDTSLLSGLACCVSTACSAADQDATIRFANGLCAGQGVTNLPQSATCAATASSASSTTASGVSSAVAAQSFTSTPASLSSAIASASSIAASASSAMASTMSGASGSMSSNMAGASASASSAQSAASGTAASAAASATASSEAHSQQVEALGMGMALAGLLAAL